MNEMPDGEAWIVRCHALNTRLTEPGRWQLGYSPTRAVIRKYASDDQDFAEPKPRKVSWE